jgi:hypothetical protein
VTDWTSDLLRDALMASSASLFRRMPRQGLQVFFGRVGGFEAELGGDFGACGRGAGAGNGALDKIEDLLLAISQFGSD